MVSFNINKNHTKPYHSNQRCETIWLGQVTKYSELK